MYTAFYGLREKPFALSPDPRFLYLAASHREALAHLLYGIEQGEGFISITGEVGTGKTTLCRTLLERLDGKTELAFLFNPSRTALELLQSICTEFGLPAEGLARRTLMTQLNSYLLEQKRRSHRVLLIIDEAQTLSESTLEQVRLLSNLETSREKLIQILLLGQPELDRKLDDRALRQLRQRISVRWKLDPLGPQETRAYVRHRLAVAAGEPKELFSEAALREIHRRTGGIPRLVNQLCDRALLAGYAARAAQIGPGLIRAAAREIPDADRPRKLLRPSVEATRRRPWIFFATSLGLVLLALVAGLQVGRSGLSEILRDPSSLLRFASSPDARSRSNVRNAGAGVTSEAALVRADSASNTQPGVAARPPLARLIGAVPPEESASDELQVSALAPGLLAHLLENRSPEIAMGESQRALLERFGRRVPALARAPRSVEELQFGVEARGLVATPFDGGSIELLRRLDHPVFLALDARPADDRDASGEGEQADASASEAEESAKWIAVTGFEGDRARVVGLLSNRVVSVSIDELEAHWLETGILVWERFEPLDEVLAEGARGAPVLWLQRALAELRFYSGRPTGVFDAATRNALASFQRDRGLIVDGIAGPLTQIALYGSLDRYPVPRLSSPIAQAAQIPPPKDRLRTEEADRG
jgi:general secretion pathway protein A